MTRHFESQPVRDCRVKQVSSWGIRADAAGAAFLVTATAMFVVLILVPTGLQGVALVIGVVVYVAAGWRAFRLSIELDGAQVVVKNFWRTHRFSWSDVEEIRPCAAMMIVLPRRALGFQMRSDRLIAAQGTGGRLRDRAAALVELSPLAIREGVRVSAELRREMTEP